MTIISVALYSNLVNIFLMVIPITLLFGALGYLFYKTKEEVSLVDELPEEKYKDEDDLYKDLEDLFI